MAETPAEIVSEHVPEIKWPEKVIITLDKDKGWVAHCNDIEWRQRTAKENNRAHRILRVQPPAERRVEIPKELVEAIEREAGQLLESDDGHFPESLSDGNVDDAYNDGQARGRKDFAIELQAIIQRHTRIVEEPKP